MFLLCSSAGVVTRLRVERRRIWYPSGKRSYILYRNLHSVSVLTTHFLNVCVPQGNAL